MDWYGVGYAYLFAGVAVFVAIIFFLMNYLVNIFESFEGRYLKRIFQVLIIISGIYFLATLGLFCIDSGQLFIQHGKELDLKNQNIVVNLSCVGYNCTANVPNNLVISCPEPNCPSPTICPSQTQIPKIITTTCIAERCPWSLSLP